MRMRIYLTLVYVLPFQAANHRQCRLATQYFLCRRCRCSHCGVCICLWFYDVRFVIVCNL